MTSDITCQVTGQVEEMQGNGSKGRIFLIYPWGEGRSAPATELADSLTFPFYRGEY